MPTIILMFCFIFCLIVYYKDSKNNKDVSSYLWIPTLWMMRCASRSLSYWLPGADANAESSLPDLIFLSTLIVMGLIVLFHRKIDWSIILSENKWLFILYVYILISVLWSDIPAISLKRWVRTTGDLVMALVILTESNPLAAINTVFRRCFILLIPLSLVFCKYFPEIGRMQEKNWEPDTWIGVATHKNTLGPLTLLSTSYYIWEILHISDKGTKLISMIYLLMSIYLLNGNGYNRSATSIMLLIVALSLYIFLRRYKSNPKRLRIFVIGSIITIFTLLFVDQVILDGLLKKSFYDIQGRDSTLTGRTLLWSDLIALGMKNSILGYGFGGFWTPERKEYLREFHPWGPAESHNGYIEIFVTAGIVGIILFGLVVITSIKGAFQQVILYFDYGLIRVIFLIIVLVHNYSEAGFLRPTHLMWFLFILMAINVFYIPKFSSMTRDLPIHKASGRYISQTQK